MATALVKYLIALALIIVALSLCSSGTLDHLIVLPQVHVHLLPGIHSAFLHTLLPFLIDA